MADWLSWVQTQAGWLLPLTLLAGLWLLDRLLHGLLVFVRRRLRPETAVWRHALLTALEAPLRALIWIVALTVGVHHFAPQSVWHLIEDYFLPLRNVLTVGVVTWFLMRLVSRVEGNFVVRANHLGDALDPTAVDAIGKLAWAVILTLSTLTVLQVMGVSLGGLLAFGGAAGIAVGFAAQSLVANLLGGLTIFGSRIFKIGDNIILPGTELMGKVEYIGWRATRVIGFDRKPFYVPNSTFNSTTIVNHSRMTHRRIRETLYLRYQDLVHVEQIIREGNALLEQRRDLDPEFLVFRFASFGEKALLLNLHVYARTQEYVEYMRIKEELLLAIASIITRAGAELTLPVANIKWQEATPESLPAAERNS